MPSNMLRLYGLDVMALREIDVKITHGFGKKWDCQSREALRPTLNNENLEEWDGRPEGPGRSAIEALDERKEVHIRLDEEEERKGDRLNRASHRLFNYGTQDRQFTAMERGVVDERVSISLTEVYFLGFSWRFKRGGKRNQSVKRSGRPSRKTSQDPFS